MTQQEGRNSIFPFPNGPQTHTCPKHLQKYKWRQLACPPSPSSTQEALSEHLLAHRADPSHPKVPYKQPPLGLGELTTDRTDGNEAHAALEEVGAFRLGVWGPGCPKSILTLIGTAWPGGLLILWGWISPHQGQSRAPKIMAQDCSLREQKRLPGESRAQKEEEHQAASLLLQPPPRQIPIRERGNRSQGKRPALNSSDQWQGGEEWTQPFRPMQAPGSQQDP